jgi:hypothetical protein
VTALGSAIGIIAGEPAHLGSDVYFGTLTFALFAFRCSPCCLLTLKQHAFRGFLLPRLSKSGFSLDLCLRVDPGTLFRAFLFRRCHFRASNRFPFGGQPVLFYDLGREIGVQSILISVV